MSNAAKQTNFFRGVYELEDPSGTLMAAKVPATGTIDLYAGTVVVVKPNQCAIFIYKGNVADVLFSGTHELETENIPVLTKLANWKLGFQSPLRCELVFMTGHIFTSRKWGSPQPIIVNFEGVGPVPIRAFGMFNLRVVDPIKFYNKLVGSRTVYSINELDELVQGQILEILPSILGNLKNIQELIKAYPEIAKKTERPLNRVLKSYGVSVERIQVLSAVPSKEVIEAMDAKAAISVIGSQKEYLLYKAATSLGGNKTSHTNDPMQMMMGLILGKGLLSGDSPDKIEPLEKRESIPAVISKMCIQCKAQVSSGAKFCSQCGKEQI